MRRLPTAATAILVAVTTILLNACGADDGSSASVNQSSAAQDGSTPSASPDHDTPPTAAPAAPFGASNTLISAADAASDPAVQSVQTSLAADSRQVAPVLHYAPGDGDPQSQNGQSGASN